MPASRTFTPRNVSADQPLLVYFVSPRIPSEAILFAIGRNDRHINWMARRNKHDRKKPLYRKVNTRTHGVYHRRWSRGHARWDRHTKAAANDERARGSMHAGKQHGLDYTPLFRFLLKNVGEDWDAVYSEAVSRLDKPDPIFWIVARNTSEEAARVCVGESSYFSGLFIDDDNLLQKVDPELTVEKLVPACPCCTHTFNGVEFTQAFAAPSGTIKTV